MPPLAGRFQASSTQQRIWFVDRMRHGRTPEYNMSVSLEIRGPLDVPALRHAIDAVAARQAVLRTSFEDADGVPMQVVAPTSAIPMTVDDLRPVARRARDAALHDGLVSRIRAPFDLTRGPLARFTLFRLADDRHVLARQVHHIVSDGWSHGVWNRELAAFYRAHHLGVDPVLPDLPLQYAEFAERERRSLADAQIAEGLTYWVRQLAGLPSLRTLASDRVRPIRQTFIGGRLLTAIGPALLARVKTAARERRLTLYMMLLAALGVAIARHNREGDVAIGSPVANRSELTRDLLGCFVNFVVMRWHVDRRQPLDDVLRNVQATALDAFEHQHVPFEAVVRELAPARRLDAAPIFQVFFALQNAPSAPPAFDSLQVTRLRRPIVHVNFDLDVHAIERHGGVDLDWRYNRDLFDADQVERVSADVERVLEAFVSDPLAHVDSLELHGGDRQGTRNSWRDERGTPLFRSLVEMFDSRAAAAGNAVAVTYRDDSLTYADLRARANQLARHLLARGVGADTLVALALDPSIDLVVALLAVLKAGAAYVPLDLGYPGKWIDRVLAHSRPQCVVTSRDRAAALHNTPFVAIDDDRSWAAAARDDISDGERRPIGPDDAAYVVYTSGSSGTPKAVVGLHGGMVNRIGWFDALRPFRGEAPVLARTSLAFIDGSTELLAPLLCGGRVVLADRDARRNAGELGRLARRHRVQRITVVPSLLNVIVEQAAVEDWKTTTLWIASGEPLAAPLARRFADRWPDAELLNLYGMSEATGDSLYGRCAGGEQRLRDPVANTHVIVLDQHLDAVPPDGIGEVYVAGCGLARGYLHDPAQTAERFVANPFGPPGSRMFKTGDLARPRPDGTLDLLGRADHDVKIAGVRANLDHLEAELRALDYVQDAAVAAHEIRGERALVAYVVCQPNAFDAGRIRSDLRDRLPAPIVPSWFVPIATLPLMPNGKIDRQALAPPTLVAVAASAPSAPATEEEAVLRAVFAELFGLHAVDGDADFFELGGHSLQAMRLVSRVRQRLRVELDPAAIFDAPRLGDLAASLARLRQSATEGSRP